MPCVVVADTASSTSLLDDEIDGILGDSESRATIVKTVEKSDNVMVEKIGEITNVASAGSYDNGIEVCFKGGKAEQMSQNKKKEMYTGYYILMAVTAVIP